MALLQYLAASVTLVSFLGLRDFIKNKDASVKFAIPYFLRDTGNFSTSGAMPKYKNTSGVTINASRVKIATLYFPKTSERISFSSVIPDQRIVTSRLDLDDTVFNPLPEAIFPMYTNSLIWLCHLAFAEHRPMALTPDLLWHYIMKGISMHTDKYSEELRNKFVTHKGKITLDVYRRMSFSKDDWPGVLKEFRGKIENRLTEEGKAMILSKFSTTTEIIDDVSCIALMDAMSEYYNYAVHLECGIPSVTLLGTREDWIELKSRTTRVLDFLSSDDLKDGVSLAWWEPSLLAVLDKLIECYDNPESTENMDWMSRIYMSYLEASCGWDETVVSGWVNIFFPYLGSTRYSWVNEWADNDLIEINSDLRKHFKGKKKCRHTSGPGNYINDFSLGLSSVDFKLNEIDMVLTGGPCSISEQTQETGLPSQPGTLHSHFGWMITCDTKNWIDLG